MKAYPQMTREYVRDGISYMNMFLLQHVIPPYRSLDEKKETKTKPPEQKEQGNKLNKYKHFNEIARFF